jgi:hypothetical protein
MVPSSVLLLLLLLFTYSYIVRRSERYIVLVCMYLRGENVNASSSSTSQRANALRRSSVGFPRVLEYALVLR